MTSLWITVRIKCVKHWIIMYIIIKNIIIKVKVFGWLYDDLFFTKQSLFQKVLTFLKFSFLEFWNYLGTCKSK